jgi:hypothetical protein
MVIAGPDIPVKEIRVPLFVFLGDHQAPRQLHLGEAVVVIPTQTSRAAMARRVPLKLLDINLMV